MGRDRFHEDLLVPSSNIHSSGRLRIQQKNFLACIAEGGVLFLAFCFVIIILSVLCFVLLL